MNDLRNIETAMQEAAEFVQATWQQAVMGQQPLPGAKPVKLDINLRRLYADSIVTGRQLRHSDGLQQSVIATKKIAEQLENGTGPWDMKPMLLGGPKARVGKNGRYNIIPFKHGTGGNQDSNRKAMPTQVYQQARQLKATIKQANAMKYGGRLPAQGKPGQNPTTGYQHKHDKYEGMVRVEKKYGKATQSQYMTFRVVSEKSDPDSWIHPGYQAHNIAKGVSDFCKPAVERMLRDAATADLQEIIVNIGVR